jgi:hypothetical protein
MTLWYRSQSPLRARGVPPVAPAEFDGLVRSQSMIQPAIPPPVPVKKAKWTPDEDNLLSASIQEHGISNWSRIAQNLPGRNGKQCRERWMNQLCPNLNRDNWTHQEDLILLQQQQVYGNLWSHVAQFLPGRSANAVKNRWSWLIRHHVSPPIPIAPPPQPPAIPIQQFPQYRPIEQPAPIFQFGSPRPFSDPLEVAPPISFDKDFDFFAFRDEDGTNGGGQQHANTFDGSALARFDEWTPFEL